MYDINTRFRLVMGLETNKWCFIEFRCQPAWAGGGLLDNARVSNYKNYRVLDKDIHPRYTPLAIHYYCSDCWGWMIKPIFRNSHPYLLMEQLISSMDTIETYLLTLKCCFQPGSVHLNTSGMSVPVKINYKLLSLSYN